MTSIGNPRREETKHPESLPYPRSPGEPIPDVVTIPDHLPDTITLPAPEKVPA